MKVRQGEILYTRGYSLNLARRTILSVRGTAVCIPLWGTSVVETYHTVGCRNGSCPRFTHDNCRSYLVDGTPATILGSNITSAVLSSDDPEQSGLFQKIGLLRSVAKKILENIGSDKHSISRLSRESKDLLKALHEDELQGVF